MESRLTLRVEKVRYFHAADEDLFFEWLDKMTVVSEYAGRGDTLFIQLAHLPTDDELRELIAFHQRYGIEMRQLAQFRSSENADWFENEEKYWHEGVFGGQRL